MDFTITFTVKNVSEEGHVITSLSWFSFTDTTGRFEEGKRYSVTFRGQAVSILNVETEN